MAINFFQEDITFKLPNKLKIKQWIKHIAAEEGYQITDLNYIFCSDEYLYQINLSYLNHATYTDIITFDNSEEEKKLEGDIFISIERVRENATIQKLTFENEILRVLAHGLFHLCGFKDKSKEEEKVMRQKEDESISKFHLLTS
jgi:probable rRNA maturation factor